jgi:hypothetical protein
LYADVSNEIHGFEVDNDSRIVMDNFKLSIRKIAGILCGTPTPDPETGIIQWTKELRKYGVKFPEGSSSKWWRRGKALAIRLVEER